MSLPKLNLYVSLGELEWKAYEELCDVADYIWKAPKLLTHEKAVEQQILAIYFPDGGIDADTRERYQSKKLNATFPRLVATGNLFLAMSVFENYVLLLLRVLQEHNTTVPNLEPSQGVAAHLKAIKAYGAEPYEAKYYEQVCTAIAIRNCLMHAKGLLASFRKPDALKAQIAQTKYLCSGKRKKRAEQVKSSRSDLVTIEDGELGDQLLIVNDYSHLVCFYLKEYFRALCGTLNPVAELRPITLEVNPRDLAPETPYKGPIM